MDKKFSRNSNIEILRFFLMTLILIWHVLVHGYDLKNIGYLSISSENIYFKILLLVITSPAVNCFMFISGFYGIRFSIKKLIYFILMSYFCFLIVNIFLYKNELFSIKNFIKNIFPFATGYWWFLTNYLIIFILSPIFEKYFTNSEKSKIRNIIIIFGVFNILHFTNLISNSGSNLTNLLFMYLLGRYFYHYPLTIKRINWIIIFIICVLFLFLLNILLYTYNYHKLIFISLSYDNLIIILMFISIFYIVHLSRPYYNNTMNKIFSPLFFIYLITEGIGTKLYKFLSNSFDENFSLSIIYFIITLITCIFIGLLFNFFYKRTIEKILYKKNII